LPGRSTMAMVRMHSGYGSTQVNTHLHHFQQVVCVAADLEELVEGKNAHLQAAMTHQSS